MPPLPVIRDRMGFYMFVHIDGRFSHAVTVNGQLVYAKDYKQYAGVAVPDDTAPIEPGEYEFVQAMGWK
jgi:hypothetical protein